MEAESMAAFSAWGPIIVMLIIFYFMLYRPQKNAAKQRQAMLDGLKAGNDIVTIGGIYGTITALDDTTIRLRVADNLEIKMARGSVNAVIEKETS